ncbi:hypothetical protein [Kordiimonas marina]|uniref:hypothetical protein n=1 Tax=Kordiimonas marina TaxID=2872312 RepID=UPI001FF14203|nr:hypothetical protein [Kordiimonas marina]MCJ9427648.1 hypothetical protein [Kordiimonas marina]
MTGFTTFSDGQTVRGLNLRSQAEEVSLQAARQLEPFTLPVRLHDMWTALPGTPPNATSVTPSWLGRELLPLMYIVEVLDGGADFRWRLFGTEHTLRYGAEATGMRLSDAAKRDTSARDSLTFARRVYATGVPCFYVTDFFGELGLIKRSYTVILPLRGPDGTVSRLFGCASWEKP